VTLKLIYYNLLVKKKGEVLGSHAVFR